MTSSTSVWPSAKVASAAFSKLISRFNSRHGQLATWLVPTVYALCLTAFITDIITPPDTVAFGVFYIPLVATAVFHRDKQAVWILCAIACVMVIIGTFVPGVSPDISDLAWNRALSICAVCATAIFVRHARWVQDRLAEQTDRAEAAEHTTSRILANLGQEIHEHLSSMINVLEVVAENSRADQKAAINIARTAGRHLILTVNNLQDLTQFDDRPMLTEPIDLAALTRQAVETGRPDARSRQIGLILDIPAGADASAYASSWAVVRILENLIADAISYTAPGGLIKIRLVAEPDRVSTVVTDTSARPSGAFQMVGNSAMAGLTPPGMRLLVGTRVAQAMGARLIVTSGSDQGVTARLCLVRASRPAPS